MKIASSQNVDHLCKFPCNFDEVYRIILAYEEQEINKVKWTYVFSGYKTYFVRPGHNCVTHLDTVSKLYMYLWFMPDKLWIVVCDYLDISRYLKFSRIESFI